MSAAVAAEAEAAAASSAAPAPAQPAGGVGGFGQRDLDSSVGCAVRGEMDLQGLREALDQARAETQVERGHVAQVGGWFRFRGAGSRDRATGCSLIYTCAFICTHTACQCIKKKPLDAYTHLRAKSQRNLGHLVCNTGSLRAEAE